MNTIEYIDAVKARYNWKSDYRIAKEMGLSQSRMSNYRTGKTEMDELLCIKVANLLELNPAIVLIDITAERTKCVKASKILHKTAKELTSAVASLFITIIMLTAYAFPSDSIASGINAVSDTVYYVKWHIQRNIIFQSTQTLFFTLFSVNNIYRPDMTIILINANKLK